MKKISILAILALACACGRKPEETPPVPKDPGTPAPSAAAAEPAASPRSGPAGYVKSTTDQIGRAKSAAALYEDTAEKRMDPDILGGE